MKLSLDAALASNRSAVAEALPEAERELVECRARCAALEDSIRLARLIVGGGVRLSNDAAPAPGTLREAMESVLRGRSDGLAVPEIASEVERRDLYRRRDGRPAPGGQIHSYVHNYPDVFVRKGGRIYLKEEQGTEEVRH